MAWSNPTRATIPGVSAHYIHYFIWTGFDRRRLFCVSRVAATKPRNLQVWAMRSKEGRPLDDETNFFGLVLVDESQRVSMDVVSVYNS